MKKEFGKPSTTFYVLYLGHNVHDIHEWTDVVLLLEEEPLLFFPVSIFIGAINAYPRAPAI